MNPEIRIYGAIGDAADGVTSKMIADALAEIPADTVEIDVPINSPGGSVSQGTAIARLLRQHPAKIHTIVEGGAFSIAGYIAVSGDRRTICADSILHIHGPQQTTEGNLEDHEDSLKELQIATKVMADRYAEVSGQSRDEIVANFRRDVFYDAEEAVAMGFMTEIGEESLVTALIDPNQFDNLPRKFAAALVRKQPGRKFVGADDMSTKTPAAATVDELQASFKKAKPEFILGQLTAKATLESATAAYVVAMEEQVEKLTAANDDLTKQVDAMDDEPEETLEEQVARLKAEIEKMGAEPVDVEDDDEEDAEYVEGMDDEEDAEAMDDKEIMAELKAVRALLAEQMAATKAKPKKKSKRFGARAFRKSNQSSTGSAKLTAQAEVDRRVKAKVETGMSKRAASEAVFKEDPALRERLVVEANA